MKFFRKSKYLYLALAVALACAADHSVTAQHEGHTMPSVSKPKPRAKSRRPTKRRATTPKRRSSARKPRTVRMPGTNAPHVHAPVTIEPGTASPAIPAAPSPAPAAPHMHTPDMHPPAVQAGPSPAPSVVPHMHAPQTNTATPTTVRPAEHETHAPAAAISPTTSRTSSPIDHEGAHDAPADTGSLMVMSGDDMGIRVGASDTNVIPMGQMASGTSWQPASTRLNMLHKTAGDWLLMFHYNAVVGVNSQGGPRGVTKFESANWFMPMAFRKVGPGTLELRGMFSFEPFTFPPGGSPLLFQTGETYKGQPIIDAQHPHDLFMELSASYTAPVGERATWFAYFGYPGEPALGPTAFMHRASASENPAAALSHHLQDSSHISFRVFTTGFTYRWFKLEGSIFNGREPDENRYNFEAHRWNSRSARLSFAPNGNWSMQVSHGLLRDPEPFEPGDVRRTTASVTYNKPLAQGSWATSLIWGRNHENHGGEIFNLNGYVADPR